MKGYGDLPGPVDHSHAPVSSLLGADGQLCIPHNNAA